MGNPDNEIKGRFVLDEYNPTSNKDYSAKLFILNLECLKKWAEEYKTSSTDLTEDSGFVKKYEKLLKNGVSFPSTATVSHTLFEQTANSKKPGLEKQVLEPPKQIQVASMFSERQQKTPQEVKKLLRQGRKDLISYITSKDGRSIDYDELNDKLKESMATIKENKQAIGDLETQDPDLIGNERNFRMSLATWLSEAEEGEIEFKDLKNEVVRFSQTAGWLGGDGRDLDGIEEVQDDRRPGYSAGRLKDRSLQPIEEQNEASDKDYGDGGLDIEPSKKEIRGNFEDSDPFYDRRFDGNSGRNTKSKQDRFTHPEQSSQDQIQKQESNPWDFDVNSKGRKSSNRASGDQEEDSSGGIDYNGTNENIKEPEWRTDDDIFKKKETTTKDNQDFFADFGDRKPDQEPENFKFRYEDSSPDQQITPAEENKSNISRGSHKLHNKSRLSESVHSKNLRIADALNKIKARSRQDIDWGDFGDASEAASFDFEGSKLQDSQLSRSKQSQKSNTNRGAAPMIRKKDPSVLDHSREDGKSFHDMFNKSKADVSMSRDEANSKKKLFSTAVKLAPPQPKPVISSLPRSEVIKGSHQENNMIDTQSKIKENRDKLWGDMEEENKNKTKSKKLLDPILERTQVRIPKELSDKPASVVKPFTSLFDDDKQPDNDIFSIRRSQIRGGSRNDSMSRDDKLALSVPVITGTGSGFGRRGRQNISIRVNRSSVGDTGIGEKKVVGTLVSNPVNSVVPNPQSRIPDSIPVIKVTEPSPVYKIVKHVEEEPHKQPEEFIDPFDAFNFSQPENNSAANSPKLADTAPWQQTSKNDGVPNSYLPTEQEPEDKQDAWDNEFWGEKKSVHSSIARIPDHSGGKVKTEARPADPQLSRDHSLESNDRRNIATGQSAEQQDGEPVFNFDDFEAASNGVEEEQEEDAFGDESLVDREKKILDPFAIGSSDTFSGQQQLGDHQFGEPVNTQVDNPDFFNSREFGNVGGMGTSQQIDAPNRAVNGFDDSLPLVSPIKKIEQTSVQKSVHLSMAAFHSVNIAAKSRHVNRNYKAFHILSRMGIPSKDLLSTFYNRVSSTPETPKHKDNIKLSIRAFSIGYYLPVVKVKDEDHATNITPRDAILLMSQLPPVSYIPGPGANRYAGVAAKADRLQDDVDRLEKDLRDERSRRSKLTEDLITAESSFMRDKAMHTELLKKHTALLSTCEEKTKREQVLQAELNQYHRRLMKLADRDNDADRLAGSKEAADGINRLTSAIDSDKHDQMLEALNSKIENLMKETVDLRHQLMEAQVTVDLKEDYKQAEESTFMEIESSVDNLKKEKQLWIEERIALQAEIDHLNERLSDSHTMTQEIDIIRQVLLMEGEEGDHALKMLRDMVSESDEPIFGKLKVKETHLEIERPQQPKKNLDMQILTPLEINDPTVKSSINMEKVQIEEAISQSKHIDFAISFGLNPGIRSVNSEEYQSGPNIFKNSQPQDANHDQENTNNTIFDSFGAEVKQKFSFDPANSELSGIPETLQQSEDIDHSVRLDSIAEMPHENIDMTPKSSPSIDNHANDIDRPDGMAIDADKHDDHNDNNHQPEYPLHEADDDGQPAIKLRGEEVPQIKKSIHRDNSMASVHHYGSWLSEDHMPSIVSPRLQASARVYNGRPGYSSKLAGLLDAHKIMATIGDENKCFLKGCIELCLLSCAFEAGELKMNVNLKSNARGFELVSTSINNYESSLALNPRLLDSKLF